MELKDRIKKARKACGFKSQSKLADNLGTTRNAITEYEMGRVVPNDVFLQLMATKLNISYEWLKNGVGEMQEAPSPLSSLPGLDDSDRQIIEIYMALSLEDRQVLKDFALQVAAAQSSVSSAPATVAPPDEKPAWMTEQEWIDFQRSRTAKDGSSMEAGSWDTDEPA